MQIGLLKWELFSWILHNRYSAAVGRLAMGAARARGLTSAAIKWAIPTVASECVVAGGVGAAGASALDE